jgi:hypothetical protein
LRLEIGFSACQPIIEWLGQVRRQFFDMLIPIDNHRATACPVREKGSVLPCIPSSNPRRVPGRCENLQITPRWCFRADHPHRLAATPASRCEHP